MSRYKITIDGHESEKSAETVEQEFRDVGTGFGWKVPATTDEPLDWTGYGHKILIKTPDGERQRFVVSGERREGVSGVLYISVEYPMDEKYLDNDLRATLVNAVSMTTLPTVVWE